MKKWTICLLLISETLVSVSGKSISVRLEDKITVYSPEALFTTFAYVTIGLFECVDRERMIPLKQFVWEELNRALSATDRQKIREKCRSLKNRMFEYNATMLAINCTEPPRIRLKRREMSDWYTKHGQNAEKKLSCLNDLAVITPHLERFYKQADIPSLWRRVQPWYQNAICQYKKGVFTAIRSALVYLRFPESAFCKKVSRIRIIPNLIGPRGSAMGPVWCGIKYDIHTPWSRISYSPHEFIHDMVAGQTRSSCFKEQIIRIVNTIWDRPEAAPARGYYPDRILFFDECLVRTLDHWVTVEKKTEARRKHTALRLKDHERRGFVLCGAMLDSLRDYESSKKTFASYFPDFLKHLEIRLCRGFAVANPLPVKS